MCWSGCHCPSLAHPGWSGILQPLADRIVELYEDFLPDLLYPVRTGEHTNSAFGIIFALEYAQGEIKKMGFGLQSFFAG